MSIEGEFCTWPHWSFRPLPTLPFSIFNNKLQHKGYHTRGRFVRYHRERLSHCELRTQQSSKSKSVAASRIIDTIRTCSGFARRRNFLATNSDDPFDARNDSNRGSAWSAREAPRGNAHSTTVPSTPALGVQDDAHSQDCQEPPIGGARQRPPAAEQQQTQAPNVQPKPDEPWLPLALRPWRGDHTGDGHSVGDGLRLM
eukprot:scaffold35288_cov36-Tisochrysis_lutea.AAC.2